MVTRTMPKLHERIRTEVLRSKMLLQAHDELVLDVPEEDLEKVQALLRECMEGAAEFSVPLEVTMGHGRDWVEAH